MSTVTRTAPAPPGAAARLRHERRATVMVWRRDLLRYRRQPARLASSFIQPMLFLFALGAGLGSVVDARGGVDFQAFVFPGAIAMTVLSSAMFSAVSVVWDREFGFLREMMVAPVSRFSIALGKALGGTTSSTLQGVVVLALAPLVGAALSPVILLQVVVASAVLAFAVGSLGLVAAGFVKRLESFQMVIQLLLMPLLFLSGAFFPVTDLPTALAVVTKANPVTYAVDAMRRIVLGAGAEGPLAGGVTLGGWLVPVWVELAGLVVLGVVLLLFAVRGFNREE